MEGKAFRWRARVVTGEGSCRWSGDARGGETGIQGTGHSRVIIAHLRIIGASGVISWGQEKAEAAGFGPALRPFLRGQRLRQSA